MNSITRTTRKIKIKQIHRTASTLASARYISGPSEPATVETPTNLSESQRATIDAAIRVDQAGEVAANWIYKGQLAVLGRDPQTGDVIRVRLIQCMKIKVNYVV